MEKVITHGSTFSGIGAPEVAAEMLGWENVFHCEINPFGRKVLDYYFPNAESYEDITTTDFSKWRGKITVLTGGFPCQPFSYAGKRRGSEDDRYLWPFMLRCIEQVRPTWFIGENVAGITTMEFPNSPTAVGEEADLFGEGKTIYELRQQFVLHEIIGSLMGVGYSVQPFVIPACSVNAPHRRDRIFIVAHRIDADSSCCGSGTHAESDRLISEWCDRLSQQGERGNSPQRTDGLSEVQRGYTRTTGNELTRSGFGVTSYTPSQRRREIYEQVQPKLANGDEPFGNGREWNVTDTECKGLQTGPDERCNGIKNRDTPSRCSGDCSELYPENRWRTFPSVSPVYRGNDGLPFLVDNLTIPFSEWKKESLKAYGNAIVPQVMYEIFRCINDIEQYG